jgi:hypothetical protein
MSDGFFSGSLMPLGVWQKKPGGALIAAPQEAAVPALPGQVDAVESPVTRNNLNQAFANRCAISRSNNCGSRQT